MPIPQFPLSTEISGIGLSDWPGYATRLAGKLNYTNTFYHCDPFLDILNPDPALFGKYDFVISSDVFEHVPPPISKAFEGARNILKPGGVLILTVPYLDGQTREHYPRLKNFSIVQQDNGVALRVEQVDGRIKEIPNPVFHGGPGSTLEMRLYGRESLRLDFMNAGFSDVTVRSETVPEYGIIWNPYDPHKARYRPLIFGLDTPPWVGTTEKAKVNDSKVERSIRAYSGHTVE